MGKLRHRSSSRLLLACLVLFALLAGCGEDKSQPGVGSAAPSGSGAKAPAAATAEAPSKPIAELEAPAGVVAFGGADNVQQLVADAQKLAVEVSPAAAAPLDLGELLKQQWGLSSADAVDLSKPARVLIGDLKKDDKAVAVMLGTKGKDKLVAALPADKKDNADGNAYSWKTKSGHDVYLNFVGDYAVISASKDLYAAQKDFIPLLINAKLPGPFALVGAVKNMMALYSADLDKTITEAKAAMQTAAEAQAKAGPKAGGAGVDPAAQLAGVGSMFDWANATAKELDRVVLTGTLSADGSSLSLHLRPLKGTGLDKTFQALTKRPFTTLAKLPADSPFFFAIAVDPEATSELTRKLVTWSMTLGLGGQELPQKYLDAMGEYWKATTGEFVFAAHKALKGKGLTLSGLMGVRDVDKVRAAMKTIGEMYKEKSIADAYKKLGISFDYKDAAYKVGDVPVATQQVKLGKALPQLGSIGPLIEDLMSTHTAFSKDLGMVVYGKDAKSTIEAFLGGTVPGGLDQAPGVVRALKNAAPGTFLLGYISPVDVAKAIDLGGKNPLAPKLVGIPASTTGVALSVGAEGGVATITLDLPTEQVKAIAQLVLLSRQM